MYVKVEGIENFYVFGEVYDLNFEVLSLFIIEGKFFVVFDFGF